MSPELQHSGRTHASLSQDQGMRKHLLLGLNPMEQSILDTNAGKQ